MIDCTCSSHNACCSSSKQPNQQLIVQLLQGEAAAGTACATGIEIAKLGDACCVGFLKLSMVTNLQPRGRPVMLTMPAALSTCTSGPASARTVCACAVLLTPFSILLSLGSCWLRSCLEADSVSPGSAQPPLCCRRSTM